MEYQALTNDSLTMMYEGIRGALAADDALKAQGAQPRFRIRDTSAWTRHAGELAHVIRHENRIETERMGSNEQVVRTDHRAATLEVRPNVGVALRGLRCPIPDGQMPDERVDIPDYLDMVRIYILTILHICG